MTHGFAQIYLWVQPGWHRPPAHRQQNKRAWLTMYIRCRLWRMLDVVFYLLCIGLACLKRTICEFALLSREKCKAYIRLCMCG